jgi:hypothetical protein
MAKPTQEQIDYLKAHPELAARFDAKFGEGMAAKILPKSALTQYAGAVTRGMAAPMVGAAMGAPFGPVGMLAGSLAVPAGDVLSSVINAIAAGGEAVSGRELGRVTPPSQMIQDLLTRAGVAKPETTGQRMVETGVGALGGTAAQLPGLMKMATSAATPVGRAIAGQMAERPIAQLGVSVPAGGASQLAAETAQPYLGDVGATLAGMAGGVAVGGASMAGADRVKRAMTNAEKRAAEVSAKAQGLGFEGETALTPAQAGTSKTAQIFEAAASTLPGSAGQFTRRYAAQSDLAENIFNQIADMFGGMPRDPSVAYASGASAVKTAAQKNLDSIGQQIREIASKTDIELDKVPSFQEGVMKARELLKSLPPAMRREPLFESFEQFYFGAKNKDLDVKVADAMSQTGMKPDNPNFKAFADKVRQNLIDSGEPEFSYQGYAQKGVLPGADYQDQRQLFGDLAFKNKGTKIGEAFRSLRDALDNARDTTFKAEGLTDDAKMLKDLRASYGNARDLNDRFAKSNDKTVVNTIVSNTNRLSDTILPLMDDAQKQSLAQAVLSDIRLSSLNPAGDLDITKFGKNVIKSNEKTPMTFEQIFGKDQSQNLVDLADVAQSALKAKVPTSGTSERSAMINMLTSGPAKLAGIAAGSTAVGVPLAATAAGLAGPAIASKAYLSPRVQNFYEGLNITDPMMNYLANPIEPMLKYAATPNLLNIAPDTEPYRIEVNRMLPIYD